MTFLCKSIHSLLVIQLVLVINYRSIDVSAWKYTSSGQVSPVEMEKIKQYLGTINKPAVKSIQSPDGDIVDCIPIDKQPAFDNPLLKNHTIQMAPSAMPTYTGGNYTTNSEVRQVWNDAGNCPDETVAIRRITVTDVLRAGSLSQFGKKKINYKSRTAEDQPYDNEYAIAFLIEKQNPIYGTSATFNVWNPFVETNEESSLSHLRLSSFLDVIEAGWQVLPQLYKDNRTRLFIYWTANPIQTAGCYDLLCSGFVQIDNRVIIGGTLAPISTYGGAQYEITILIWKDPKSGNWWMKVQNVLVGYWPAELFTALSFNATVVEWGGEVINTSPNGVHTSTAMGSGHFPDEGFRKASYISNLMTVDSSNNLSLVKSITTKEDHPYCYDAKTFDEDKGLILYFGGPGNNPFCP
ncbi:protein neprosin-like [Typha angustifolia]|uniref:protein neprosin-like n=1 Tax=Typha angustifolia TaxID=59011 RepID=UPI003C2AE920